MFGEKTCLEVLFEGVEKAFLSERKGNAIPCRRAEDLKKKKQRKKRRRGNQQWKVWCDESKS